MLKAKTVADSKIENHVYKIFPNDLNAHKTVFGGQVMAIADRLSLVVAERHSGRVCVTASVDSIHFMAPAKENDTLLFSVSANRAWGSSMEIGVRVVSENSYTGEQRHIASSYMTFVALDSDDRPVDVPELITETEKERKRFAAADLRRQARLSTRESLKPLSTK